MITILPPPKLLCAAACLLLGLLPVTRAQDTAAYTALHTFAGGSDSGVPVTGLLAGSDGNLYETSAGGTLPGATPLTVPAPAIQTTATATPALPPVFFRVTPQGVLTPLYASATTIGGDFYGTDGFVQGSNGSFYGTNVGGDENGDGSSSLGSVYQLTVDSHPAFFTGQAPLIDGVDYLASPTATSSATTHF